MLLHLHKIPFHKLENKVTANQSILFHISLMYISNKQLMPWEADSSQLLKKHPAFMELKGLSKSQPTMK
jgi:hypothetical protein